MASPLSKAWMRSRSIVYRVKETTSNSDVPMVPGIFAIMVNGAKAELVVTGISEDSWRKAPTSRGMSCDAILHAYSLMAPEAAMHHLSTSQDGLTEEEAVSRLHAKGPNLLSTKKPPKWWQLLLSVIPTPFNALLTFIAVVSVATPPPQWSTFIILAIMIVVSVGVQFWQEYRSSIAAIKLQSGVTTDVRVRRRVSGQLIEGLVVDEKTLVPGDILLVDPGDSVPADCMILEASNLNISQSR